MYNFNGGDTGLAWSLIQKEIGYRTKFPGGYMGSRRKLRKSQTESETARMPTRIWDSAYRESCVHTDLVSMYKSTIINH